MERDEIRELIRLVIPELVYVSAVMMGAWSINLILTNWDSWQAVLNFWR